MNAPATSVYNSTIQHSVGIPEGGFAYLTKNGMPVSWASIKQDIERGYKHFWKKRDIRVIDRP